MFKHIQTKLLFSYLLVLLSCFLIVAVTASLFIRKTYFSYALDDLKHDAGLFIDEFIKGALVKKDTEFLQKILEKAEENYTVEIFDMRGAFSVNSKGEKTLIGQDLDRDEFEIIPDKGYGYIVRKEPNGVKTVYVAVPIIENNDRIGFVRISTPILYIENTINRLQIYVALIFTFAIAVSFLISIFLARGISSPLLEITSVAREISSGNLKRRVDRKNRIDEIGDLMKAFNEMVERLRSLHEERKVLLGNISHELMTPITTIRGFAETICDGKVKDKKSIEDCLEAIRKESNYLEGLIEELQLISRIDALSMKYDFRPVKITDVILDAEKALSIKALEKDIKIRNDFLRKCSCIKADYKALRQVFVNLLDNAIKYSSASKDIAVSVKRGGKFLIAAIEDYGMGISPRDKERIFERFYRVEGSLRTEKGIGLGLAIVSEILRAHKATIQLESKVNEGSKFILTFPIA